MEVASYFHHNHNKTIKIFNDRSFSKPSDVLAGMVFNANFPTIAGIIRALASPIMRLCHWQIDAAQLAKSLPRDSFEYRVSRASRQDQDGIITHYASMHKAFSKKRRATNNVLKTEMAIAGIDIENLKSIFKRECNSANNMKDAISTTVKDYNASHRDKQIDGDTLNIVIRFLMFKYLNQERKLKPDNFDAYKNLGTKMADCYSHISNPFMDTDQNQHPAIEHLDKFIHDQLTEQQLEADIEEITKQLHP